MANNQIKIGVGFQIDKTGINELQNSLKQIQASANAATGTSKMTQSLKEAASTAKIVDEALEKAFNVNLGTTNLSKFNQELKKNNLTIDQVRTKFSQAGQVGQKAWNLLGSQILKTNIQLKQSNKLLDEMATSMANTVKWGVTSSIFNTITQSISKAYTYTKKLDGSLNDIRIVTDKSAESMEKFAKQANSAAKELGASTLDYTEASLIYYQQGLDDADVQARTETTLKAANVTGQSADEVSEQLTAVWNGYKVSAQEAELYVDKLAAVASTTAADLEELSTGMSKVASAANAMGVDIDQLNAQLATIVSVTRQAPESVGTALKTIYARMSDLKLGGTDEDGLGLGDVSGTMEAMGIDVLDASGNLRDMGKVIEDVAAKWDTWTEAQKTAMAQVMAGKRQYNNLVALFDNWDMYTDALNTSADAAGTLQKQQDIYLESTNAKLQQLRTTAESVYSGLIKTDELNVGIDLLTDLIQVTSNFVNSFGGGIKSIGGLLLIVANIFSKQLSNGINNLIIGHKKAIENAELYRMKAEQLKKVSENQINLNTMEGVKAAAIAEGYQKQAEYAQKLQDIQHNLSQEEYNRLNTLTAEVGELTEQITLLEKTAQFTAGNDIDQEKVKQVFEGEESFEDDIANTSNQLEIENKKLQAAQDLDVVYTDIKKLVSDKNQLNEHDLALTKREQNYISNILKAKKEGHISEEEANRKIQKFLNQQQKANKDNIKLHQKKIQQLETEKDKMQKIQEMAGEAQRLDVERGVQESDLNTGLDVGQQSAKVLEGVTKVTSALSTMAMSWMSINSLMDTWGDKSLSLGEKISQTLMTVGMTLPMLISSFKSLSEVMGVQTGLWAGLKGGIISFKAQIASGIPAHVALINLFKTETAERIKEDIIQQRQIVTQEIENRMLQKYAAMKHIEISAISESMKAQIAESAAKKAETMITEEATIAQNAFNTSLLASPFTWVILGLAAVVGAISAVVSIQKKQIEQQNELAKQSIEEQNKIQDEINANTELYNSYMKTFDAYKKGKATKEEMKTVTDQLCEKYNLESATVAKLTGDYEKLTQEIINSQTAKIQGGLKSAIVEKGDAETLLLNNFKENSYTGAGNQYFKLGASSTDESKAFKALETAGIDYSINDEGTRVKLKYDMESADEILATYDKLKIAQAEMSSNMTGEQRQDSEVFQDINNWIKNMEEYVETYRTAVQDVQTYSTQLKALNIDFYNVDDLEEYKNKRKQLIQEMQNDSAYEGKTTNELENMADTFIAQQNDSLSMYNIQTKQIEKMVKEYGTAYENEVTNWIKTLPEEQLGILMSLDLDSMSYEDVQTKVEELYALGERNSIQIKVETIANLQDKIAKGEEITPEDRAKAENQLGDSINWEDFDASISLEQINLLGEALNELNQQRINNYNDLKNAEEENQKNEEKRQERIKELTSQLEEMQQIVPAGAEDNHPIIKSIKEELKELENLSYDINLDIDLDDTLLDIMEDKVDNIVSKADQLKNVSELIGEGFVVAAEDVELLSSQFPALMQNADVLADGSIRLQEEIVGTVLNGNAAILESNKNITDQQLEDQIILLEAEIESNNSKIKLMTDYLTGKIEQTELEGGLEKEQAKLESKLINALGEEEYKNTVQAAINNAEMTSGVLSNLDKIGLRAKAVGEAIRAALAGEAVNYAAGGNEAVTTTLTAFQNQNIVEETSRTGKNDEESKYIQEIERQRDELLKTNEEYEKLVASKKYQQSKLRSGVTDATKSMKSAADGTGGKIDDKSGDKDKKEEKKAEDEIDRYWELNKAIAKVEEALSDLDKQQEKLYGRELINSLKKENELLSEQASAYEALAAEQRKEAGELQGMLQAYGVVFDAQGGIANYMSASMAMLEQYNAAVVAFNAGLIDEATFGITERNYENFKSMLDRYDTLYYEELKETQNKLDEIHRKELENNLQAWEIEIQLKLDMKELKRQWNDFFKEINENFKLVYADLEATMTNLVKNAKTYADEDGDINTITKAVKDVTAEIDKMRNGGESDMFESISQAQEKLKELNEQLQDSATAMRDLWQEAWDTYLEGIDQAADKFDDLMDRYDAIGEQIEYQKELIELLYGDKAYDLMSEYYDAQLNNNYAQIDSLKQQADMWKKQYETAKAIDEANGTNSEDTLRFYELWQEAQQEVNNKVTEYIKLLQDDYQNTVNEIFYNLEKFLSGGTGFDEAKEQWDLLQKQAEGYYDDVERIYQLNTLSNKYEKVIANTSGINNQKKLQELYNKEMKYLEEKKNLSEYDIEIANAKYDMTLKQIALEEAQQNKNAMKLTRGADGNWSYQYVANEDEVAQKEQDLLDATNNYYQIAKDGLNQYYEDILAATQEFLQKMSELEAQRIAGTITEEDYNRQKTMLDEAYNGEDGIITKKAADFNNMQTNMSDATLESVIKNYELNLESYEWMTSEQQLLLDGLKNGTITNYDEMLSKATDVCASTLNTWSSLAANIANLWYSNSDSVKQEILKAYILIEEANRNYQDAVDELAETVDQDFGEEGIKGAIDNAKKATNELEDETKKLVQTAEKELPKYREQVNLIEQAWYSVKGGIESAIQTIEEYLKYVGETKSAVEQMVSAIEAATAAQEALNTAKANEPTGTGGGEGKLEIYAQPAKYQLETSWIGQMYGLFRNGKFVKYLDDKKYPGATYAGIYSERFDTGGYTGEWSNGDKDGRLAWLHQKELVLNSMDTANILSVVDTVRDITNIGNSIESSIMNNIGKTLLNLMSLGKYKNNYEPQLVAETGTENIFNITAEFPNANDVASIREAILNLPNIASQYLGRNKK